MLVADVHVEHAHFGVQPAEQQHRVPVAEEPADRPSLARSRGEQHEPDQQHVGEEQPVPPRSIVGGEEQNRGGRDGHVQQGDEVDGGEALHDGTTERCQRFRATCRGAVV